MCFISIDMQLFFLIGIFAAFVLIGFYIWRNYRARKSFFESILSFCNHLGIEIAFSKNHIGHIIERYGSGYSRHFRNTLNAYNELLRARADITHEALTPIMWNGLKAAERIAVTNFFFELGRHGVEGEHEKLAAARESFGVFHKTAGKAMKSEASIYLKLSIIIGIGAVILLI